MDLIAGEPVSQAVRRRTLDLDAALRIAIDAANGVGALHDAGIVHRDLKPDNIMLRSDGGAVILDLGLAVAPEQDQRLTRSGDLLGTLAYMAPEQLSGGKAALPQTDVYALGLILFELVTGESSVPEASSQHELIGKILNQSRALPSTVDPELPVDLDRVFQRATAVDPEQRYPNAGALALALRAVADRPGPSRKTKTHRRIAFALAASLGAVALAAHGLKTASPETQSAAQIAPTPSSTPNRTQGAAQQARAREARVRLVETRDPRARHRGALAWLKRYADLPQAPAVRAIADHAARLFPRATLFHPGNAKGWFFGRSAALTLGADGSVREWDLSSGQETQRWETGGKPRTLAVTPKGTSFALEGKSGSWRWLANGTLGSAAIPPDPILTMSFSRDGTTLLEGGQSHWVHLREQPGGKELRAYGQHNGYVVGVGFTRNDELVISASSAAAGGSSPLDNGLRFFNAASRKYVGSIFFTDPPTCLSASPDQHHVVVGLSNGELVVVDQRVVEEVDAFSPPGRSTAHPSAVVAVSHSPDGSTVYSVGGASGFPGFLRVWDAVEGTLVREIKLSATPTSLDISPDGSGALVGTAAGRVELWTVGG
jgi:hypothetical protein